MWFNALIKLPKLPGFTFNRIYVREPIKTTTYWHRTKVIADFALNFLKTFWIKQKTLIQRPLFCLCISAVKANTPLKELVHGCLKTEVNQD